MIKRIDRLRNILEHHQLCQIPVYEPGTLGHVKYKKKVSIDAVTAKMLVTVFEALKEVSRIARNLKLGMQLKKIEPEKNKKSENWCEQVTSSINANLETQKSILTRCLS